MSKEKIIIITCLFFIFILNASFHFYRLNYPSQPIWDEVHFATYASDYVKNKAFFDIHPPLGKLIFAAALKLSGQKIDNPDFITFEYSRLPSGNINVKSSKPISDYGSFPYVWLRSVSVIFGLLLPFVFYLFLRRINLNPLSAILGAFFITFENALLLDTRLILLNGMFLVFGLAALTLFFDQKRSGFMAGLFFGLALSVKLTAVVFLGPLILDYFLAQDKKEKRQKILRFLSIGFVFCFILIVASGFIFSFDKRIDLLKTVYLLDDKLLQIADKNVLEKFLIITTIENFNAIANYVTGSPAIDESPWYLWPLMQKPLILFENSGKQIILTGNVFLWFSGTLAVLLGIFIMFKKLAGNLRSSLARDRTLILLLSGYFFALSPFIVFVQRSTFLYHYFPSLLFALGLVAYLIQKFTGFNKITDLNKKQVIILTLILLLTLGGFISSLKFVYGL